MCSILITNKKIVNLDEVNFYLKFRGPDHTSIYEKNGITFVHNLLSISGEFTPQPFVENNIVAMHNGEIYNYGYHPSDGYSIIPTYKLFDSKFPQKFEGEFAVVVADFDKNRLIFSTDIFGTKPLWFATDETGFGISTYRTPLEKLGFDHVHKCTPNEILEMNLSNYVISIVDRVYEFDLNQHKTTFDDWTIAFENAIRMRTQRLREKIFIGLSSGYDSGSIACELDKQEIDYYAFTVTGKEPLEIVNQRIRNNHRYIQPSSEVFQQAHSYIVDNVENFMYTISSSSSDYNEYNLSLYDDNGANGLSMVCNLARQRGIKIYLSGMGADEIFSDYGFAGNKIYPHSNFGGKFPEDLTTIFPWNSFFGSSMESYLAKEEYVSGAYGIEGRYPFLDKHVVQEFLWLTADLKNSEYKSVLDHYLTKNSYPYLKNRKIGF